MSTCLPCEQAKRKLKRLTTTASNIVEGYSNLIFTKEEIEELSKERMEICNTCTSRMVLVRVNNVEHYKCGECNCPLAAATRAPGKPCDLGKWKR